MNTKTMEEKTYSREAFENAQTDEERKALLKKARNDALLENHARSIAQDYKKIGDDEVQGEMSEEERLGGLSDAEKELLERMRQDKGA